MDEFTQYRVIRGRLAPSAGPHASYNLSLWNEVDIENDTHEERYRDYPEFANVIRIDKGQG